MSLSQQSDKVHRCGRHTTAYCVGALPTITHGQAQRCASRILKGDVISDRKQDGQQHSSKQHNMHLQQKLLQRPDDMVRVRYCFAQSVHGGRLIVGRHSSLSVLGMDRCLCGEEDSGQ